MRGHNLTSSVQGRVFAGSTHGRGMAPTMQGHDYPATMRGRGLSIYEQERELNVVPQGVQNNDDYLLTENTYSMEEEVPTGAPEHFEENLQDPDSFQNVNNSSNFNNLFHNSHFEGTHGLNAQSDFRNTNSENLSINRMTNAIEHTLSVIRNNSLSNGNSKLINRLTSAKTLPSFSGDPLDWVRFKRAFETSTETGAYTDRENVSRLFEALKDDALEATRALFASGTNSIEIMRALEMRFGNSKVILSKIINQIKNLPPIESGCVNLVEFASTLRNSVLAIKSLSNIGYLYNTDLVNGIIQKIPNSMIFNYIRYASNVNIETPDLVKISNFLYDEANMALKAGVMDFIPLTLEKNKSNITSQSRTNLKSVFLTDVNKSRSQTSTNNISLIKKCAVCNRRNHTTETCRDFTREPIRQRWKLAKTLNLCFNCLSSNHARKDCKSKKCNLCSRNHHQLLHFNVEQKNINVNQSQKNNTSNYEKDSRENSSL